MSKETPEKKTKFFTDDTKVLVFKTQLLCTNEMLRLERDKIIKQLEEGVVLLPSYIDVELVHEVEADDVKVIRWGDEKKEGGKW